MPRVDFDLYLITDRRLCREQDMAASVEKALKGGVGAVQLRDKNLTTRERYELGLELRRITASFGAKLLVNGDAALALAIGADGVHLPQDGLAVQVCRGLIGPDMFLGVSTHNMAEAAEAEEKGADFVTFGPVYFTPSKARYGAPVGPDALRAVCAEVRLPVFALGGVGVADLEQVVFAGAAGAGMITAILAAADPESATAEIIGKLRRAREATGFTGKKG